jgi:hypothetical protein
MTLTIGSRLGPYEVLARLGAGGMGEVWRGRDTRLGRAVAIKVLPADLAAEGDRLKRFEREARAASSLSHPNIVTVYEIERIESAPVIVMELVEGRTIRELMAEGPLPLRHVLSMAPQIADGLARAHASGIVHRDLKPENVMVTGDGLVKILDFGLAKLTRPEEDSGHSEPSSTVSAATRPGIAMGTVGYMSPEQASGHPVDFRSDQFALGSILYEMAAGKPAFKRATTPQTLAAIIEDEPEPIGVAAPRTPAPLRWVIGRCLAKEPKARYASTEDLARELSDLRDHISDLSSGSGIAVEEPRRRRRFGLLGVVAAAGIAMLGAAYWAGRRVERAATSEPRFRQLTYRGAGIGSARFAPDGQTIVFSSETEGRPPELLSVRLDGPEVRTLGLPPAHILSISPEGEMALLLLRPFALYPRIGHMAFEQIVNRDPFLLDGTLAQASLAGGTPSELLEDVTFAEWGPGDADLAVVRRAGNRRRVEFPIGTTLFENEEDLLNHPRIFRRKGRIAFKDWGVVFVRDVGNAPRRLSPWNAFEIAWRDSTGEIWYNVVGPQTEIHAFRPTGTDRLVTTLPGDFVLYDIAADGRLLLGKLVESTEILGTFAEEPHERNLSYFDRSAVLDLSARGDTLLFADVFRADWTTNGIYLRKTDGSPPKRLRDGGMALSPDGRFTLASYPCCDDLPVGSLEGLLLAPTGPGQPKKLEMGGARFDWIDGHAGFFPDGRRIYFVGGADLEDRRVWVQEIENGRPRAVTPKDVRRPVLLGDGRFLCARGADFQWHLYPSDENGAPRPVAGILPGEEPFQSTPDGKWLYVRGADELRPGEALMTTRIYRLDPLTGKRELWKEIPPRDPRTGGAVMRINFSADGKTCVWTHMRYSTELVVAEGLK